MANSVSRDTTNFFFFLSFILVLRSAQACTHVPCANTRNIVIAAWIMDCCKIETC